MPKKALLWAGAGLGVVLAILLVITAVLGNRMDRILGSTSLVPLTQPPSSLLVCRDQMTKACARTASVRVGRQVAWVVPPTGFTFRWMTAVPSGKHAQRFASEVFTSPQVGFELMTNPGPMLLASPHPGDKVTYAMVGGIKVRQIISANVPSISLDWSRSGVGYQLLAYPVHLSDPAPDPALLMRLATGISYEMNKR